MSHAVVRLVKRLGNQTSYVGAVARTMSRMQNSAVLYVKDLDRMRPFYEACFDSGRR